MADTHPHAAENHRRRRPCVLQWNAHSLRRRHADLSSHLLQSEYDVLALQEVYVAATDLRLPGYIGYQSITSCTLDTCQDAPCIASAHPQGRPRCAVYVRRELPHVHINVADVTGGALECCAVTVRLRGVDTTVASVYVRPGQRWDASMLLQLTAKFGRDYLICGDMNAHHTMWGSSTCSSRGRDLVDVIHQLGLQVLNTGSFTFVRRTARPSCSAIDVTLASEGDRYDWAVEPDSWGSDHLPIVISPVGGKIPRRRLCSTIDWRAFRRQLRDVPEDQDFLNLVAVAAQAATIQTRVPEHHPVPDLHHLNLRAARRRAERRYLKSHDPAQRTLFNRVDAVCRRHANRRRRQSWQGICLSLSQARGGAKAWRLLRSLVTGPMVRQPVIAVAIYLGISEKELAERLADRFTELPPANPSALIATPAPKPPQGHHPAWTASQIASLCQDPIFEHELNVALARTKRRSSPGADGITYQMLRNLDMASRRHLLRTFNEIWQSGNLPEAWLTAVVVPIRKPRRPCAAITSYRPVSLTSAACKLMEAIALARLNWIAGAKDFLPEQQTGFRRHRCTADSIADVVSTLEEAKRNGEVALLVLLDVQSAFDSLPHIAIESALDTLGIVSCLRTFISAFLAKRTLRVRVRRALSDPRPVTAGVPQGSVLSPFLFNLVLAGLPTAMPADKRYPTQCSLYADDVALWVKGPRQNFTAIRRSLQRSLDAVVSFFKAIGLNVSPTKTEALLVHPRATARRAVRRLVLGDRPIPWSDAVTYLGLRIDHRLTWIPAVKLAVLKATRVETAVSKLLSRGQGCTSRLALRLYEGAATTAQTYALPLVQLAPHRKEQLERQHRMAIRRFMGLPRQSPIAATLAEAQTWPLSLLMLRQALHHVDRLHRAPGGAALLRRLRSRPASRMAQICALYEELVPDPPSPIQPPPPHQQPLDVQLTLDNLRKRRTPACELHQAAVAKLHERLKGQLLVFTDGSVRDSPHSAAAACVIPSTGTTIRCRLPFHASSTAAELAGLHLAADHLAATLPQLPVAILCDSRPALQALLQPDQAGITVALLHAKLTAIKESGVRLSLHWLPSHVGIAGNEEADAAAKAAHHCDTPVTKAVTQSDYSRQRLRKLLPTAHPDTRVASGKPPPSLPETGLDRCERRLLLRLRTGSVWPAARMYSAGRSSSPACRRCGDDETLQHIVCSCPDLATERCALVSRYRLLGLPAETMEDILFPARSKTKALRAFLEFCACADLAAL